MFNGNAEKAWRYVSIVPAVIGFASGVIIYFISDDSPKGNYAALKKRGIMREISPCGSFWAGAMNINTGVLFIQYACCFGVELTMNNATALYFREKFGLSTVVAGSIASIFGWMNLFARGLGGFISDLANTKFGMRGRIWVQTILLLVEGSLVFAFCNCDTLPGSIFTLIFFSIFVQACEGASYGIVPYVDRKHTGTVTGIVGAGGNAGAVAFGFGFRGLDSYTAFVIMGSTIIFSAFLSIFFNIRGHSSLLVPNTNVKPPQDLEFLSLDKEQTSEETEQTKVAKVV
jgi:NNP family nitrate/nitrite transporter-like MFS transporter